MRALQMVNMTCTTACSAVAPDFNVFFHIDWERKVCVDNTVYNLPDWPPQIGTLRS